jgi:plastocyanin
VTTPTPAPTAQPQVVHVGFTHAASTDPTFGAIAYYTGSSTANAAASVVTVVHGSQLSFMTDSTSPHTASGLGTSGFPGSGPASGATSQTGTTIDGSSWSTGTLEANTASVAFTVGAPGNYYFGCFYHYSADGMRDVIVSQ